MPVLACEFQKKGTRINVAYWIAEDSEHIPDGLAFKVDPNNDEHWLLVVTKPMIVTDLINKLNFVGLRMAIMTGLDLEAFQK